MGVDANLYDNLETFFKMDYPKVSTLWTENGTSDNNPSSVIPLVKNSTYNPACILFLLITDNNTLCYSVGVKLCDNS